MRHRTPPPIVAWKLDAVLACNVNHRRGHVVVAGEDRGWANRAPQQAFGALQSVSKHEIAGLNPVTFDRDTTRAHLVREAKVTLLGSAVLRPSPYKTNCSMPEIEQMGRHAARRAAIVDTN